MRSIPSGDPQTRTYALLLESLDDEHEVAVLRGAIAAAKERDLTVLCIPAGLINDTDAERAAQAFAFELARPPICDGIVAATSAIGSNVGAEQTGRWLQQFSKLPICCLGVPIFGYQNVIADGAAGVRDAVRHLAHVHHARNIGFIQGPPRSLEAQARYAAYQEALKEAELNEDDKLVFGGDYMKESGRHAICTLLDEHRIPVAAVDAIVAANDYMAFGAIEELGRRGLYVPDDLAVIGFDDVDTARSTRPPLTTVRQHGELLGRQGVEQLDRLIRGDGQMTTKVLPTELVVRRSCGCMGEEEGPDSTAGHSQLARTLQTSFVERRPIILAETMRAARGSFGPAGSGWEARLLDSLIAEVRGAAGAFCRAFEQICRRLERSGVDSLIIQEVLSALRRQSLPCVGDAPASRDRLEAAMHEARTIATVISVRGESARVLEPIRCFHEFAQSTYRAMFDDLTALNQFATEKLPTLGITACVLAEFDVSVEPNQQARVLSGFGPGSRRASREVLPIEAVLSHSVLARSGSGRIVLPLASADKPLGVAVLSVTAIHGELLEELRGLFKMALGVSSLRRTCA